MATDEIWNALSQGREKSAVQERRCDEVDKRKRESYHVGEVKEAEH